MQNNDCISDSKRMKNTVAIFSSIIAEACTQQLYENSMDSTANRIGAETSTVKNLNGFFAFLCYYNEFSVDTKYIAF